MAALQTRPTVKAPKNHFFIDYTLYQCPIRLRMSVALLDINGDYWTGALWHSPKPTYDAGVVYTEDEMDNGPVWPYTARVMPLNDINVLCEKLTEIINTGGLSHEHDGNLYFTPVDSFHHMRKQQHGVGLVMRINKYTNKSDWWNPRTEAHEFMRRHWINHFNEVMVMHYSPELKTGVDYHSLSVRAAAVRHKKRLAAINRAAKRKNKALEDA